MLLDIHGFDYEGRGVARHEGKTVFVGGALPGEKVRARETLCKKNFSEAQMLEVLMPSPDRVEPACLYYEKCGGCALQHVNETAQHRLKETVWLEQLSRIGHVEPQEILPAITTESWHYRSRARLAWQDEGKRNSALGFRGRASRSVVNVDNCLILPTDIGTRLSDIRDLCIALSQQSKVLGVDVSEGDKVTVLRIRLQRMPVGVAAIFSVIDRWNTTARQPWQIWLQSGKDNVIKWPDEAPLLTYELPDYGLSIPYAPDDFTQVNKQLNRQLVRLVLTALDPQRDEKILDFFCGLGNFSLPLAAIGADVFGLEGVDAMVARANRYVVSQGLAERCHFQRADLFEVGSKTLRAWGKAEKWLLDPPRAGAQALCEALTMTSGPKCIVYVSCNPGTLARDAGILSKKGYRMVSGRLLHMFDHTAHVESLAVFMRD
ncbi:MAG: 23S rRNA methyltransferase [Cardiobacteriaceae bacterium]|nr:23S rRNA methyltransferase [Cardiobacteriaceae bacterium]